MGVLGVAAKEARETGLTISRRGIFSVPGVNAGPITATRKEP
jgi:hypothetical protein